MALGITTLLSVVDNGSQSYTFTLSDVTGITVGDHVGSRLSDNSGSIYRVTAVSSPTITVQDDLIEAETAAFGLPDPTVDSGKLGYGTPTTNNLTQLPYSSPGWDAAGRRNHELLDVALETGGAGSGIAEIIPGASYTFTSEDIGKIFYATESNVSLTLLSGLGSADVGKTIYLYNKVGQTITLSPSSGSSINYRNIAGNIDYFWSLENAYSQAISSWIIVWDGSAWSIESLFGSTSATQEVKQGTLQDVTAMSCSTIFDNADMLIYGTTAGLMGTLDLNTNSFTDGTAAGTAETFYVEFLETAGSTASINLFGFNVSFTCTGGNLAGTNNLQGSVALTANQSKTYWMGEDGKLYLRNVDGGAITSWEDAFAGGPI